MEALLSSLNERQKEAALCIDRHVRIVAGAGSGKTRVLMARIEYLLKEAGVFPSRILAITFTNKAAQEMKDRLMAQVPDLASEVRISTIHALCVRILREDAAKAGFPKTFAILDGDDQKAVLRKIYKEMEIHSKDLPPAEVLGTVSRWKRQRLSPQSLSGSGLEALKIRVYEQYQKQLEEMKAMDFDDLLIRSDDLLSFHEEIRTKWQNRLDYLHVDEFQDVDPIQYSIIRQLVRPGAILAVVGDPDQTIYTWRGASVDIILNFEHDFSPSRTVILSQNYRSSAPILKASNALIANNRNRVEKELFTQEKGNDPIVLLEGADEDSEAMRIAQEMKLLHRLGMDWKDMAVLYRSSYLSRSLEKILLLSAVPYRIFGGIRFYERAEIKDMLSYLRLLSRPDPEDPSALSLDLPLERIVNVPKRAIGPKFLADLSHEAEVRQVNLLEAMNQAQTLKPASAKKAQKFYDLIAALRLDLKACLEKGRLPDIIDQILQRTGYKAMLEDLKEEGAGRLDNILELKKDLETALEENPELTLEDYLQDIALFTDHMATDQQNSVTLMTVHAAKGTEFPAVFVMGVNENVFPSARALNESGRAGLEEERRLMYVAMTRAKKKLMLSWNSGFSYQSGTPRTPSRFLKEIPAQYTNRPGSASRSSSASSSRPGSSRSKKSRMAPGTVVFHRTFGEGIVIDLSGQTAQVTFKNGRGTRKIRVDYLQEKNS